MQISRVKIGKGLQSLDIFYHQERILEGDKASPSHGLKGAIHVDN